MQKIRIQNDKLASFLYDLMRDHLPCGVVQELVGKADSDTTYTNGYLAEYARYLSEILGSDTSASSLNNRNET